MTTPGACPLPPECSVLCGKQMWLSSLLRQMYCKVCYPTTWRPIRSKCDNKYWESKLCWSVFSSSFTPTNWGYKYFYSKWGIFHWFIIENTYIYKVWDWAWHHVMYYEAKSQKAHMPLFAYFVFGNEQGIPKVKAIWKILPSGEYSLGRVIYQKGFHV